MEEADKDWMVIRMVGGCFFWYRLTRVVPYLNGRKTVVVVVVFARFRLHCVTDSACASLSLFPDD